MALVIAGALAWYFVLNPGHRGFHMPDFKTGASLILFFVTAPCPSCCSPIRR